MERATVILLSVLIVAVLGLGVVVWRADQHAEDRAERLECFERIEATAVVGLLAPGSQVDEEGRLDAMQTLAGGIEAC
jgi:hypothetical protein